ncbi:Sodium/hydrogen exchanger family-domain-containing protein [Schizophyllum amplum]|uniref:Sodium/hydrogen exchanger family-domain-containing protein n=1 Tax=Schizophyllum amplum TaxID=97359 RepID=A0A550C712_9AGAR|nr:Sodium/hydrogen exchanger family-domain-containing protein [Auriculariopsis ampla]
MYFHPFEVNVPHVVYTCLGGFIVIFGMVSLFLREKLYIGEANWAFLFGIIVGPYGANVFDPRAWAGGDEEVTNSVTLEFTRVVLAIGVFAIGVELPKAYMARHWKSIFMLLGPIMTYGWFVCAGLIYALIPGLNFLSSLAVAACLTPTDPILAAAVIGGKYADKHVPAHIRHLLAAESGCNDGAAFPFLFIAIYLTIDNSTGKAIGDWFLMLWLYQVILGTAIGIFLGWAFRHLMKFGERRDLIDRHSYVAQYVSLALLTVGVGTLLGSDDLLASFACGAAFAWDGFFNRQTEESVFSSVIDLLFNIAAFIYVGAWMPFDAFSDGDLTLSVWRLIVIAILILLLRRLPIMIALYRWIPDIKTFREAVFTGHFGPMGIGAVFISTLAAEILTEHEDDSEQTRLLAKSIQPIVAFIVLCSIVVHGLSIPGFSLGRRVHSVSRTWSRHATGPEWTTQARHVNRGEDVVINRDADDAMERGELEKEDNGGESSSTATPTAAGEPEKGPPSPEMAPDGDDVLSEWQEGHHTVVERRAGPGEEVEVEVIRNTDGHESMSNTFRTTRDNAPKVARDYMHRLHHAPEHAEHEVEAAAAHVRHNLHEEGKAAEETAKHAEVKAEDFGHKLVETVSPPTKAGARTPSPAQSHVSSVTNGDDDDEAWASDEPNASGGEHQSRSRSPRMKGKGLAGLRKGKRRSKTAAAHPTHHDSIGSLRHPRLQQVRASGQQGREASPVRSIRFADEDAGRRGSVAESDATGEVPESPSSVRNSGGNHITFDLPNEGSSGKT